MGLDLTFANDHGWLASSVVLSSTEHDALMTAAEQLRLTRLTRFRNYYEDVELDVAELEAFIEELEQMGSSLQVDGTARTLARRIGRLAEAALAAAKPLLALAD